MGTVGVRHSFLPAATDFRHQPLYGAINPIFLINPATLFIFVQIIISNQTTP